MLVIVLVLFLAQALAFALVSSAWLEPRPEVRRGAAEAVRAGYGEGIQQYNGPEQPSRAAVSYQRRSCSQRPCVALHYAGPIEEFDGHVMILVKPRGAIERRLLARMTRSLFCGKRPPEVALAILEAHPDAARGAAGLELLELDEAAVVHDERPLITRATLL